MMIWLKNVLYAEKEKQIGPFYLTMFYWRKLPEKTNKSREISIKDINIYIIKRIIILLFKWILFEILYRWITNNIPEIPEGFTRFEFSTGITKGIPALTPFLFLLRCNYIFCHNHVIFRIRSIPYYKWNIFRFLITLKDEKSIFFFEKQHMKHIKEWCISMIYDTNHMFRYPYLSTSPRDLWSFRWQLFLNEVLKN
ncbi:unnamed protein product [Rhizophagus irregularis]|nr:unnamed protein product [Rhizophagus irregularis]